MLYQLSYAPERPTALIRKPGSLPFAAQPSWTIGSRTRRKQGTRRLRLASSGSNRFGTPLMEACLPGACKPDSVPLARRQPSLWGGRRRTPRCDVARLGGPPSPEGRIEQSCFRWGLPEPASPRNSVSSYLTISPLPGCPGGMFLWHFPSSCPDRTLSCTLPGEARTFLTPLGARLPGTRETRMLHWRSTKTLPRDRECDISPNSRRGSGSVSRTAVCNREACGQS